MLLKLNPYPIKLLARQIFLSKYLSNVNGRASSSSPVKISFTSFETTSVLQSQETPIMIMHGLLGSKNNWNSIAKAINAKTKRKVIAVDARNHGESPHASEMMNYDGLACDILQLMQDLEMPKATLIGHSMGGRAMMKVALNRPDVVDSLVVVDVSPINVSPSILQLRHYIEAMQKVQVDPQVPRSSARKVADDQLKDIVEDFFIRQFLITNLVESQSGYRWRVNLECLARSLDTIAAFPYSDSCRYEGETIFIGGGRSDYIKVADHEAIRALFPRAVFRYIPGAGHWVHSEKTTDFLQVLLNFLLKRPIPFPSTTST